MTNSTALKSSKITLGTLHPELKTTKPNEFFFKAEKKSTIHHNYYTHVSERKDIIFEVGDAGLLLYEYYLALAGANSKVEICDKAAASYFGWDISKAKRVRQKLTRKSWFKSENFIYSDGTKGTTYYLGKKEIWPNADY